MAIANKTLASGWRCEACEYSLEGLPDRADETQGPECGYVGRPVGSAPVPRTAAMALTAIVIAVCVLMAGFVGMIGYAASQADTSDRERLQGGLIGLGVATAILYVGVVVWAVPLRRWRVARWIGALVPAALGAMTIWSSQSNGFFDLAFFAFSVVTLSYLLYPEMDRWLSRLQPTSVQR